MTAERQQLKSLRRWVIKVGSAILTDNGRGLDLPLIEHLAAQIAALRQRGIEVVLVSSGSVAAGVTQLAMGERPKQLRDLQAAAAVGQASLVRHYEEAFKPYEIQIAQILLSHADIASRERYLNARSTLTRLLELQVLGVVNENDSVATEEICLGDNDRLAALVCNLVEADLLVMLTDQDGVFTADPRINPDAELLDQINARDESLLTMAGSGSAVGRGGMITKLEAARIADRNGASTVIANGRTNDVLASIYLGNQQGTLLMASQRMSSKKQWLAGQPNAGGAVILDAGAVNMIKQSGKSLLPVGVTAVDGRFQRGELISCVDQAGVELARGLSNYSSSEAKLICGKSSDRIAELLGYGGDDELIHRNNLVLL